jgi:hypothetical protein
MKPFGAELIIKFFWGTITLALVMIASPYVALDEQFHYSFDPNVQAAISDPDSMVLCILDQAPNQGNKLERVALNSVIVSRKTVNPDALLQWKVMTQKLTNRDDISPPNPKKGTPVFAVRFKKGETSIDAIFCPDARNVYFTKGTSVRPFFARDFRTMQDTFDRLYAATKEKIVVETSVP